MSNGQYFLSARVMHWRRTVSFGWVLLSVITAHLLHTPLLGNNVGGSQRSQSVDVATLLLVYRFCTTTEKHYQRSNVVF